MAHLVLDSEVDVEHVCDSVGMIEDFLLGERI